MNFLILLDPCENPTFLKGLLFGKNIVNVIFVIIPVVLIVMLSVDLFMCVIGNQDEQKKNMNLIFKRIVYSVCLFFVPSIVNLFLLVISDTIVDVTSDFNNCIVNMDNIEYFEEIANRLEKAEEEEKNQLVAESNEKLQRQLASEVKEKSTSSSSTASSEGTYMGQTYRLTEEQLRGIAMICQREQGSVKGAMAEASLMANRFELFGSNYGTGGTGLYNYVANCRWWGSDTGANMKRTSDLRKEILSAVRNVLVNGNRTLVLYVDEHDCIDCGKYGYDIIKIVNNDKSITDKSQLKKHSNYISNVTRIYNRYGAVYTFSTFPETTSDPFGFTASAKSRYDKYNNG